MLKKLFDREDMFKIISFAKDERIDKQYYVTSEQNTALTKESAQEMASKSEDFVVKMKLLIANLKNEEIEEVREKLKTI